MDANNKIFDLLRDLSLNDIIEFEKEFDEQYKALKYLYENIKDEELFLRLIVLNALVSYQLTKKGEEYWWDFAKYFSRKSKDNIDIPKDFLEFLRKYNPRFLSKKIERINKAYFSLKDLKLSQYCNKLKQFLYRLSKVMNQNLNAKTITFSIKMLNYGCRIIGKESKVPKGIMIPLDYRISKLNKSKEFWIDLENRINIPLLHLDSVLWVLQNYDCNKIPKKYKTIKEICLELHKYLNKSKVSY